MANRWRQYGASVALVQLLIGCSPEEAQKPPVATTGNVAAAAESAQDATPDADTKLIVVFGDSLYAGYNLEQSEGFAPVLEKALNADGMKARVVNAGVSGDTSKAGLERLAFTLDGLPRKPDLVIVGLGGNDMLRGLSPDMTRSNLDAILGALKQRGIPTMLTGMLASPNMGADYAAAFNPIYADLAKRYDVPLYPFFLDGVIGHRDLQLPDGIHPNAGGVTLVVRRVAPLVEHTLRL